MATRNDDALLTPSAGSAPGELDPDIRRFVTEMSAAWGCHPDLSTVSPDEARRIAEQVRAPWTRGGPEMALVLDYRVPVADRTVRVRSYHPTVQDDAPALIYLHGGGWTLFSLDTHDRLMRELARRARAVVLGVEYSLAPEAKYPVALDEVCAVVEHASTLAGELGIDPRRLAIGGDSAGGNLAIATCLAERDRGRGGDRIAALVLIYAVLDRHSSAEARERLGGPGQMLGAGEMEQFWANYLRDGEDATAPLLSPARADLRHLPPTLLVIPELDLLAEQSLATAERLREAGVATEARLYRGACHSFLEAVSIAPLADRALGDIAEWLRSALSPGRSPED